MSDEMIQQVPQQKGVNPLWPLGAAVVGGVGTNYAINRYASSPYKSVEDLIAEKEDTYNGKKVNGEAQTKAADKAKATIESTVTDYDKRLAEYKEANKFGVEETPEYKELVAKQTGLQEKVKGLEVHAGDAKTTKPVVKSPISAINHNADQLYRASEQLNALKEAGASKEAIAAVQANIEKQTERLNNAIAKTVENATFTGTEAEIKAAKEALKLELEGHVGMRQHARDVFNAKRPVNAVVNARTTIAEQQKAIEDALKTIKETSGYDLKGVLEDGKSFDKRINTILKIENNKTTVLEKLLNDYAATPAGKKPGVWTRLANALEHIASGKPMPNTPENVEFAEFFKNIKDTKHKEIVERLLNGKEVTKEEVEKLLAESKERAKTITEAASNIKASKVSIESSKKVVKDKLNEVRRTHGKTAYINEAGEICKDGKVVEKPVEFKGPEFAPKDAKIKEGLPKEINLGTTEVLSDEAKELANAKKQLERVTAEVEAARGKLPKTAERSAEELTKEFVEQNGTKRQAITDALKKCESDLKPLFEKKWGNGKVAAAIAGGAAIAGLLGYAIAPKRG